MVKQREIRDCCVHYFKETFLILDEVVALDRWTVFRAEWAQDCGRRREDKLCDVHQCCLMLKCNRSRQKVFPGCRTLNVKMPIIPSSLSCCCCQHSLHTNSEICTTELFCIHVHTCRYELYCIFKSYPTVLYISLSVYVLFVVWRTITSVSFGNLVFELDHKNIKTWMQVTVNILRTTSWCRRSAAFKCNKYNVRQKKKRVMCTNNKIRFEHNQGPLPSWCIQASKSFPYFICII